MLPLDEESDAEAELAPSVSVPDGADAPPELQRAFWVLVTVFNTALLAGSLGAMFLAFRGDLSLGGSLLVLGLGLGFYGWRRYQTVTDRDWSDAGEGGGESGGNGGSAEGGADDDAGAGDAELDADPGTGRNGEAVGESEAREGEGA